MKVQAVQAVQIVVTQLYILDAAVVHDEAIQWYDFIRMSVPCEKFWKCKLNAFAFSKVFTSAW